jgi:class 3 adenylate cyclase
MTSKPPSTPATTSAARSGRNRKVKCALLFADVSGSTRLYEQVGDRKAQTLIGRLLDALARLCREQGGRVVKTIGDEIMCVFPDAATAARAAAAMHEFTVAQAAVLGNLSIHAGLQAGTAILRPDGDVFGDAVNMAARLVALAKSMQTLTTAETLVLLPAELQNETRRHDHAAVKGKSGKLEIVELLWRQDDLTRPMPLKGAAATGTPARYHLVIKYRDKRFVLDENTGEVTIGRGEQASLQVSADSASRQHACIRFRRGKFLLVDQSTNGTYIMPFTGDEVYLKHDEYTLTGSGTISLGKTIVDTNTTPELIQYQCNP